MGALTIDGSPRIGSAFVEDAWRSEYHGAPWSLMPSLSVSVADDGAPMPSEVLTIKEVAALLKLAEKTVYSMANAGEIPAFKIRGQWRIKRAELDQWLDAQPRGGGDEGDR